MSVDADLIIIGGGCAGLSLASLLAEHGADCPRTIIVESRTHYTNDRTWCFWDNGSTRLHPLIRQQWHQVSVSANGRTVNMKCDVAYQMLPADVFYADALSAIANNNRINLRLGSIINAAPLKENSGNKTDGAWQIDTSGGFIRGTRVVDTRPVRSPAPGGALLWQSFYGQEIECDAHAFEAAQVELMDFSEVRDGRIAFTYVLPLSRHRALIEATVFAADPLNQDQLTAQLEAAILQRLCGSTFSVLRSEHGVLPMGAATAPVSPDRTWIKAGLTAGGARPATGYAFQRIQRWAALCANAIIDGKPLVAHPPDPLLLRLMDRLFLQLIRASPQIAPELFLAIFENADANRLIRFLSDRGKLTDYLAIIRALPPGPFLNQIVAQLAAAMGVRRHQAGSQPRP